MPHDPWISWMSRHNWLRVGRICTAHWLARTYIKYDYELPPFSLRKIARVVEYQGLQTCV